MTVRTPVTAWAANNNIPELAADGGMDKEIPKNERPFLMALRQFFSEVSVVGARYISNQNIGSLRRLLWAVLISFGIGFAIYQIYEQASHFLTFPVSVKMNITDMPALEFPTVTVCNENAMNKSKALELDPSGNLSWAMSESLPPVILAGAKLNFPRVLQVFREWDDYDWRKLFGDSFMDYDELMIECRFDSAPCDSSAFSTVITNAGNCIQFNPTGNISSVVAGSVNGLQLVLTAAVEHYNNPLSPSAGFRILIHHHSEAVKNDVLKQAFKADVNQHTAVKVQSEEIKRLPEPYGKCLDEPGYIYTQCSDLCYERYILENCGCGWPSFFTANITVCTAIESTTCVMPFTEKYTSEKLESTRCDCPQQCNQQVFPYKISSGKFSKYFLSWMQRVYEKPFTAEYMEENLAFIDIYFDTLEKTEMVTQPAYTLLSLLCDIGGALGLILGSTVLTVFEILDFCLISSCDFLLIDGIQKNKRKIQSINNSKT